MYNTSNPAELYAGTTWELLPNNKFIKTGATPLQQAGSNSIKIAKANLPTDKLQVESFSLTTQPHNHGIKINNNWSGTLAISGGNSANTSTTKYTENGGGNNTGNASPYTSVMGNGTPLSINPEHITIKAWKRLS